MFFFAYRYAARYAVRYAVRYAAGYAVEMFGRLVMFRKQRGVFIAAFKTLRDMKDAGIPISIAQRIMRRDNKPLLAIFVPCKVRADDVPGAQFCQRFLNRNLSVMFAVFSVAFVAQLNKSRNAGKNKTIT